MTDGWQLTRKSPSLPPPAEQPGDSLVLTGASGTSEIPERTIANSPELANALELFRLQKYGEARSKFYRVARNKESSPAEAEAALYYEAECFRMQSNYPKAAEIYRQLVKEYPRRAHYSQALQRMFDIANYWLDETRDVMDTRTKNKDAMFVRPVAYLHLFDKTKPTLDMQGRALQLMETVYLNDIDGPLGEKALFYMGSINFFNEAYIEADHYFHQVVKFHPNGQFAPRALKLSIICKQMATGGSDYDGRRLAEARNLIQQAGAAYPELVNNDSEFLQRQVASINMQQADADYNQAKFYERTGHPGSAYFYYEIVRRRYPGTKHAQKAEERMEVIRERAEREKKNGGRSWWNIFGSKKAPENVTPDDEVQLPVPGNNVGSGQPNIPGGGPSYGPSIEQLPIPNQLPGSGNGSYEQIPQPRVLPPTATPTGGSDGPSWPR